MTVAATRRIDRGRGHTYLLDGQKADGVTWVTDNGVAKRALIDWAANTTAGYAIDHWDELGELPLSERLTTLQKSRYASFRAAGIRGTDVHQLAQQLAHGEEVDVPEELVGHVDAYLAFVRDWEPEELIVEAVVGNRKHGYMGTLDLVAHLADGQTWLLDWKTGGKGIYPESALQLAAYRHAEFHLYLGGRGATRPRHRRRPHASGCAGTGTTSSPSTHPRRHVPHVPVRPAARPLRRLRPRSLRRRSTPATGEKGGRMSLVPIRQEIARAWVDLMAPAVELAKAVANTEFVPKAYRGNPAAITAAILYGDEIGFGPMQSLTYIAVVDGRPTLYAEAMRAKILAEGHDLWVEETTATRVTVAGRRRDSDQTSRVTWTMDDARRANIAGKPSWRLYPRQMLLARASAELARAVFADAIGGLAAYEELAEPADGTLAPRRRQRRRGRRSSSYTETAPVSRNRLGVPRSAPNQNPRNHGRRSQANPNPTSPEGQPLISDPQRRKMNALFREKDISDRNARLRFASNIAQRPLQSSLELTMEEASRVIDALEEWTPTDPQTEPFPEDY